MTSISTSPTSATAPRAGKSDLESTPHSPTRSYSYTTDQVQDSVLRLGVPDVRRAGAFEDHCAKGQRDGALMAFQQSEISNARRKMLVQCTRELPRYPEIHLHCPGPPSAAPPRFPCIRTRTALVTARQKYSYPAPRRAVSLTLIMYASYATGGGFAVCLLVVGDEVLDDRGPDCEES